MSRHSVILVGDGRSRPVGVDHLVERDDSPVSGGVGAVLARGFGMPWSEEADAALLAADRDELPVVARCLGIALSTAQSRQEALQARIMEMMAP